MVSWKVGLTNNQINIRVFLIRMVVTVGVLFFIVFALGITIREPIEAFSRVTVERFGVVGLFVAVSLVDCIPGLTNEPLLLLALSGGLGYWVILLAAGSGSVLAGMFGWVIGGRLRKLPWLRKQLKTQGIELYFERYGGRTVAVAAVLPIPFALCTWAAGAAKLDFKSVALGSCLRIPKTWFYLTLIYYGWGVNSGM